MTAHLPEPDEFDSVRLLTIPKTAELLSLSERTVYRLISSGDLPITVVWGKQRVAITALREYLSRQRAPVLIPAARRRIR